MKTIAASIAMLLIVLIGGILITRKPGQPQRALPSEHTEVSEIETSPESTRATQSEEELPAYYQVIIDNNLFLPLGWKTEVKSDVPFQLVGTVLMDALGYYQAVLKSVDTQRVYFVTLDEVQDGWSLVMIEPKRVVLEKGDRRITLALNEQQLFITRQYER